MYLLDTNHCSGAILGNSNIINRLATLDNTLVATCVIVQGELIDMAERSRARENNLALVQRFLQGIYIYNVDETTATLYGQLKASLFNQFAPKEKSKRRKTKMTHLGFDENDLWITAIALQQNLTIVSADSDFQRIRTVKALSVESWL
ncbi:PIN domain nuclease [Pleurocapsa sp. CCALA 161]|jgi:tRNA(fMet)-specific endonuclease VapC|uniref:type II toxin-antitoxin system VapC family toxin n=1 Tax=Pleurocapsa sp. CCALA 161 TaxID=2107688 RepID=UPI000D05D0BA|nr:type II toxin-antitoxin system VapC family toxin [Pleurocapsa sp. CCALA 161]PSB07004.1 PIN domain nuclease [Pleurocapsa sp. CCALA 161]